MVKHWWKALGVVILLYVFTVGFLVPLKSGIYEASPFAAKVGSELVLKTTGYNTHFKEARIGQRAWLKLDSTHVLAAQNIEVVNDQQLNIRFQIPAGLPTDKQGISATLVVDNTIDGAAILPQAVRLTQTSETSTPSSEGWLESSISNINRAQGVNFPFRNILGETIRNTYFHVALWFAMLFVFLASVFYSIRHLLNRNLIDDLKAESYCKVGVLFGVLGLVTGAIWAKFTWGQFWSWDIKQTMTAVALAIYSAYLVFRMAIDDPEQRGRVSAAYNIFAFAALIPLIYVVPRMYDSLHPGSGGNPAFGGEDLDNTMRMVFYPAIIGWSLVANWIAQLMFRGARLNEKVNELILND